MRSIRFAFRSAAILAGACLLAAGLVTPAHALDVTIPTNTIVPATAAQFAQATYTGLPIAVTHAAPPGGTPIAVSDNVPGPLAGFPTEGSTFGILSTGNALFADDPNSEGWRSANNGGGPHHGANDRDVVTVVLTLQNAPHARHCVSFDFRFLTEEYPEWVGSRYNDTFLAMVNTDAWSTNAASQIFAPANFARDEFGNTISVNTAGAASVAAWKAGGTTYDGATSRLTARTVVTDFDGFVDLYLTIFDVGDQIYDSAVFIDRVKIEPLVWFKCWSGLKGRDFDVDVNLDGGVKTKFAEVSLQAQATFEEGQFSGEAYADVQVSLVLAEEVSAEEPLQTCPLWKTKVPVGADGLVSVQIPPAATLSCPGLESGAPGKYLTTVDVESLPSSGVTYYGFGSGGYVVE